MTDTISSLMAFDESTYLASNPDVSEAVQEGLFSSGLEHYFSYGFAEGRGGVSASVDQAMRTMMEKVPAAVPPEDLRKRAHGDEDLAHFEGVGRRIAFNLYEAIGPALALDGRTKVLDFGCGCGRVMKYFYPFAPNSRFYGSDIDEEAIAWCQSSLGEIGRFSANQEWPPLRFDDQCFDFVYAISVFTHLPEEMQFRWLEELRRVTRRGGYLILTTHGDELVKGASRKARKQFQEKGFCYSVGSRTQGLPDYYQTAFHSEDYIRHQWSRFFEILKIVDQGIAHHQDLVLCRRAD